MEAADGELAEVVLRLQFGEACGLVGKALVRQADGLALRELEGRLAGVPVRQALVVLLLHGCASYVAEKKSYEVSTRAILERLRYPRMLQCVETSLGTEARDLMQTLMCRGATPRRYLATEAGAKLVRLGYIRPCAVTVVAKSEPLVESEKVKEDVEALVSCWTREPNRLWRCRLQPLRERMLRELCETVVHRKLSREMRDVCSAMFRCGAWKYGEEGGELMASGVPPTRLFDVLPTGTLRNLGQLRQYLESLRFDAAGFAERVSGTDAFVFDAQRTLRHAREETLHMTLVERYGAAAARIHALLRKHSKLDQAELAERGLLPPKETRALLYKFFHDGVVDLIEVANAPQDQFWAVDIARAERACLTDARLATRNLVLRREFEALRVRQADALPSDDWAHGSLPLDRLDHAILKLDEFTHLFEDPFFGETTRSEC